MRNTIQDWQDIIHDMARDKGWWDDGERNFGELMALIHSEITEAFEEYRNGFNVEDLYYNDDAPDKPEGISTELADVIIRILDICGYYSIDIERVLAQKVNYNSTRPHRHGGKKA